MLDDMNPYLLYGLGWFSFGLVHSLLAREAVKSRLKPVFGAYYRLVYNGFAVGHLAAIYIYGLFLFEDPGVFLRGNWLWWGQIIVWGSGIGLLVWALRGYDLSRLAGTQQIRDHRQGIVTSDEESLHFKGLHCWVRHPLYSASFLILWGRISSDFDLFSAVFASLYLVIGTYYEERHLVRAYGALYADYRRQVPAYIPWKGRIDLKDET